MRKRCRKLHGLRHLFRHCRGGRCGKDGGGHEACGPGGAPGVSCRAHAEKAVCQRQQPAGGRRRKRMKLLIFSDIHGDKAALERLMDTEADYYFAAGDLSNFARGLDKLGPVLARRRERMFVIPGNHESEKDVADFCESFGFENLHGKSIQLGKYWLAALGYSNITPFQTPGEYTEAEIARRLNPFESQPDPLVLICHCPPKGTRLDRAGADKHFGSTAVREFIDRRQPVYFYCGHVHEAAGEADRIGRTQGWNVGKTGVVLEI